MSVSFERSGSTPSANAAGSLRTSRARARVSPAAKIAAAGLVAVLLAQYLAGFFFLWSLRLDVRQASPLTVVRYGYWYGEQASVRRRLEVCSFHALCLVMLSALAVVWPRRKSLHGDARFATRREVLEAGLLDGDGILLGRL